MRGSVMGCIVDEHGRRRERRGDSDLATRRVRGPSGCRCSSTANSTHGRYPRRRASSTVSSSCSRAYVERRFAVRSGAHRPSGRSRSRRSGRRHAAIPSRTARRRTPSSTIPAGNCLARRGPSPVHGHPPARNGERRTPRLGSFADGRNKAATTDARPELDPPPPGFGTTAMHGTRGEGTNNAARHARPVGG